MPSTAMRERSVSRRYGRELTAPRDARAQAGRALRSWGLDDHVPELELIVTELVTNAIRHGAGPVEICLSREHPYLHLEVHDDGPGRLVRRHATPEDESGRGLTVIDDLMQPYGGSLVVVDDETGHGKTVCVSVLLPDSPPR